MQNGGCYESYGGRLLGTCESGPFLDGIRGGVTMPPICKDNIYQLNLLGLLIKANRFCNHNNE